MRPKRLDLLLLRSYLGPFIMSFAIILFLLVMQFMSLYMNEIFGKGIDLLLVGKLFFFAGGRLAITAMPIAILAGALFTFGSMGEHYELAAIKSGGISLFRLMRSVLLLGVVLSALSFWFSYDVIPKANLKFFSLLYDIQRKKPDVALKPGHFYSDIDGYVIRVSDKNTKTGKLYDVIIYDHLSNTNGNTHVILADSGSTFLNESGSEMRMILYAGSRYEEYKAEAGEKDTYRHGRTYFDSLYYRFNLSGFDLKRTDESQFRHQITMTRDNLVRAIDSLVDVRDENQLKYLNQLGRYTLVDTLFERIGQYRFPEPTKKDLPQKPKLIRKPGTVDSFVVDSLIPVKKLGEGKLKQISARLKDTTRSSDFIAKKPAKDEDTTRNVITDSVAIDLGQDSVGKGIAVDSLGEIPIKAEPPFDTVAVEALSFNGEDIFACFDEYDMGELLNRALVDIRAMKSYLEFMVRKRSEDAETMRRHKYELYSRTSIPLTCLFFMMLGASLGAIIRKGGIGVPALLSILSFILFYILITQGKKLAREDVMEPFVGAFLPLFVLAPVAVILTLQATSDSRFLDESVWASRKDQITFFVQKIFKNIVNRIGGRK